MPFEFYDDYTSPFLHFYRRTIAKRIWKDKLIPVKILTSVEQMKNQQEQKKEQQRKDIRKLTLKAKKIVRFAQHNPAARETDPEIKTDPAASIPGIADMQNAMEVKEDQLFASMEQTLHAEPTSAVYLPESYHASITAQLPVSGPDSPSLDPKMPASSPERSFSSDPFSSSAGQSAASSSSESSAAPMVTRTPQVRAKNSSFGPDPFSLPPAALLTPPRLPPSATAAQGPAVPSAPKANRTQQARFSSSDIKSSHYKQSIPPVPLFDPREDPQPQQSISSNTAPGTAMDCQDQGQIKTANRM